jgi:3-hydroxyacyl-CoA dehydrogenase
MVSLIFILSTLGAGIAEVSAVNGKYRVLLKDKDANGVARGEKVIEDSLQVYIKHYLNLLKYD